MPGVIDVYEVLSSFSRMFRCTMGRNTISTGYVESTG